MFDNIKENAILVSTFQSKEDEMGLFDKIKGLVVETDDAPALPPVNTQTPMPVTQPPAASPIMSPSMMIQPIAMPPNYQPSQTMPMSVPAPISMPMGGFNQEIYDKIMTVLEKNNIDGFDYYEFRQSIANASAMPLPEPDKFRTIFAMAQPFGVSKDKLLGSIDFYISKLDEHKTGFQGYIQSLRDQEVVAREQKQTINQQQIQQKSDMIRQLTDEINLLTQDNATLATEVYTQTSQINAKEQSFSTTFEVVIKQLNDDRGKIDTYIASEIKQGV